MWSVLKQRFNNVYTLMTLSCYRFCFSFVARLSALLNLVHAGEYSRRKWHDYII